MAKTSISLPLYNARAIDGALASLGGYLREALETLERSRSIEGEQKARDAYALQEQIVQLEGLRFALVNELDAASTSNGPEPDDKEPF